VKHGGRSPSSAQSSKVRNAVTNVLYDVFKPVSSALYGREGCYDLNIDYPENLVISTAYFRLAQFFLTWPETLPIMSPPGIFGSGQSFGRRTCFAKRRRQWHWYIAKGTCGNYRLMVKKSSTAHMPHILCSPMFQRNADGSLRSGKNILAH